MARRRLLSGVAIFAIAWGLLGAAAGQDAIQSVPDIANMSVDEVIALRVETMRSNGATLRGANMVSGPEAVARGRQILANATKLKLLFPEGSNTGNSNALDLIWQDWDNFIAILDKLEADALAVIAAAESGDADAFGDALRTTGSNCSLCHTTYRADLF